MWCGGISKEVMKTIIAGSRNIWDYSIIDQAVFESGFEISEVISGFAQGVDTVGEAWSLVNGLGYATPFKANWDKFGLSAGHRRNLQMGEYADALVAVWDGKSPGTKSMIKIARQRGLKIFVKDLSKVEISGLFVDT
jgi:hypothetical protein